MPDIDEGTLLDDEQLKDDAQDTTDQDGADKADDAAGGEGEKDEFFLEADDRHRYRTREDAIKAISESGRRISELSAWESEVGQAFGGLKPSDVKELINELVERRETEKKASAASRERTAEGRPDTRDPKVIAQEEANRKWLKENGFLTQKEVDEKLKELRDTVETLKSGSKSAEEERFNRRVEEGETYVKSLVSEAKLPEKLSGPAIKYITGCLSEANDPEGKLFAQFLRGGDSMRETLKSLFDEFQSAVSLQRANASSAYQQGKEKSANAGKPLPKGTGGSGKSAEDKNAAKNLVHSSKPDVHDAGWKTFQESLE